LITSFGSKRAAIFRQGIYDALGGFSLAGLQIGVDFVVGGVEFFGGLALAPGCICRGYVC